MIRKLSSLQVVVFAFLLVVNPVSAESDTERVPQQNKEGIASNELKVPKIGNGVNCFDYYKFNSVQVSVGPNADIYKENQIVEFSGTVENQNLYPVVDGNVLVRISKKSENARDHGHLVIDEFFATKESINLDTKEKRDLKFNWNVPKGISAGEYQVDYFFTVGKRFNLGGLPFSYEVKIGSSSFTIDSENKGSVAFDQTKTKINGEPYKQIGNSPLIDAKTKVIVEQVLANTTDKEQDITLTQELYYWDSLRKEDLKNTRETKIKIPAGESKKIEFTIDSVEEAVSFVKMTATYGNQKSVTWVRFVSQINNPRINYPGLTKFPLSNGETAELFSCFHNTSELNTNGKLTVTLTDKSGATIANIDYLGSMPSNMSAVSEKFTAKKNLDYVKVTAVLKNDKGDTVDEYSAVYDCKEIGCKIGGGLFISPKNVNIPVALIAGLGISFFAVMLVFMARSRKK